MNVPVEDEIALPAGTVREQTSSQTILDREDQQGGELINIAERLTQIADRIQGSTPAPVGDTAKGEGVASSFEGEMHRQLDRQFGVFESIRVQLVRLESFI